jgi:hypothetical protein
MTRRYDHIGQVATGLARRSMARYLVQAYRVGGKKAHEAPTWSGNPRSIRCAQASGEPAALVRSQQNAA